MLIPHAVELLLCQLAHWKYFPKRCLALIFEALSHSHLVMSVYKHIGWSFNIVCVNVGGCLSWSLWYPWPGTLPHTQQGQMSFSWIIGTNKPRKNLEVPFALLKLVNISVYLRCSGCSPDIRPTWVLVLAPPWVTSDNPLKLGGPVPSH